MRVSLRLLVRPMLGMLLLLLLLWVSLRRGAGIVPLWPGGRTSLRVPLLLPLPWGRDGTGRRKPLRLLLLLLGVLRMLRMLCMLEVLRVWVWRMLTRHRQSLRLLPSLHTRLHPRTRHRSGRTRSRSTLTLHTLSATRWGAIHLSRCRTGRYVDLSRLRMRCGTLCVRLRLRLRLRVLPVCVHAEWWGRHRRSTRYTRTPRVLKYLSGLRTRMQWRPRAAAAAIRRRTARGLWPTVSDDASHARCCAAWREGCLAMRGAG